MHNTLGMTRRKFFRIGSAAVAGSTLLGCGGTKTTDRIRKYRTLGRTGFKVSDISLGCGPLKDANVARYVYDKGINYFDTGETYGNGASEKALGEAMQFFDRKKIWITTKLKIDPETDTETTIIDRFRKCLERLQTDYVDALYNWSVIDVNLLNHEGFHSAVEKLKAEGRIRHLGVSSHGPRGAEGDSMSTVLTAAAEDGRYDLMLLVYNFMNREEGEKILAACKKHNIGTTAMKTRPGRLLADAYDPEHPTESQQDLLDRLKKRGMSEEEAEERLRSMIRSQEETAQKTKPFAEKYGIQTEDRLLTASVQWVLNHPDMHTVCVGMRDMDMVDKFVPVSGMKLSAEDSSFLEDYALAFHSQYCRHGCNVCSRACPHHLPVSTVMRYSYYFEHQGRQKYAMAKYTGLDGRDGSLCRECDAPCIAACPYRVPVRAQMMQADRLLKLV